MEDLDCDTQRTDAARPLRKIGRTIITFDGETFPEKVIAEVLPLSRYNTILLVCYSLHQLVHKEHVCRNGLKRCQTCREKEHEQLIESTPEPQ